MKCTMYHSCSPGHVVQERVLYSTLPCVLRTRRRNRNRRISFVCVWMCVYFLNKMIHHLKKVKCQFLTLAIHENHLETCKKYWCLDFTLLHSPPKLWINFLDAGFEHQYFSKASKAENHCYRGGRKSSGGDKGRSQTSLTLKSRKYFTYL